MVSRLSLLIQYQDIDDSATFTQVGGDEVTGFMRLQRDF
jgi:hypothetical protein